MNAPIDVAELAKQFATSVGEQLDARQTDTEAQIRQAELVTATFSKPLLMLPQDLQVITGMGRSAVYKLIARPGFPPTFHLGRVKYCRTADFLAALDSIQTEEEA